ncbi:oxidoreductase [Colletotrichum navitas]|uniref:Oxidoreductase n=1 Tax=Colletotrichum navitas TaxID=681940 RepID=A0AAD8PTU0_9PEZI|nr:oxidoreductase [Colletotrichum navitas]KAK1580092.1 oxidoreductase [Colletotrichum navitas]
MPPYHYIAALTVFAAAAASETIGAKINDAEVTEIFGNSFGMPGTNATYDYVVVGGGTAGNALAARLALDPANYPVALIEAGTFYEIVTSNRTQIPGYNFEAANPTNVGTLNSLAAIQINTEPIAGCNGRKIGYVQGVTFGGASAANYGGYSRSTAGAHDLWAEDVKDDYWSWDNVFPFYKKSCDFTPPDYTKINPKLNISYDPAAFDDAGGPLQVSYGNYVHPSMVGLGESMEAQGLEHIPGFNSGKLLGYGAITSAVDRITATRSSSETSFLQAGAKKAGLKIYPNAMAKRILFDGDKKATGVVVEGNSKIHTVQWVLSAKKEVILTAGVWRSPQLLMVSGVGPSETLSQHGIDVVADVPGVGQNQWVSHDQPFQAHIFKVNVETNSQIVAHNPEVLAKVADDYLTSQSGPLSSIGATQAVGYEKFPPNVRNRFLSNATRNLLDSYPSDWPDLNFLGLESSAVPSDIGPDEYYLLIGSTLYSTAARGNMTIKSADTLDAPVINPNWLGDERDLEMAVAAFTRIREVALNSTIVESAWSPGPEVQTKEEIVDWIRSSMSLTYHGACTNRMEADDDETAVVDTRGRVRGVKGLRVGDASAFAILPPGYPMATTCTLRQSLCIYSNCLADSG